MPYTTSRSRAILAALLFVLLSILPAQALPWWSQFPRIVQGQPADLKPHNADIVFNGGLNAPSCGLWGQILFGRPQSVAEIADQGGRAITYFETFGQSYCVVASIPDGELNKEAPRASASHWSWAKYSGDPIYWAGAHSWFDDLPEARPQCLWGARTFLARVFR